MLADLTEEPVLNRIPLGGPGGQVADGESQSERIGDLFLQGPLPHSHAGSVAPAAVRENEQVIGLRIMLLAALSPPVGDVLGGELGRVVRGADKYPPQLRTGS